MSDSKYLTLSQARKIGLLQQFANQQEHAGIGPINPKNFDHLVKAAATALPPQDQTSGSRVRGGSTGKKIR